jgi:eukaryotic-like serine/threonine-protein kinase
MLLRRSRRLPDDLIDRSLRRLGNIALGIAVAVVVVIVAWEMPGINRLTVPLSPFVWVLRGAVVALSVAMFVVSRSPSLDRRWKSNLGIVYEVVGAGAICAMELGVLRDFQIPVGPTSSVVMWILLLRLLVPVPLHRATVAAFASAAMVPLIVWWTVDLGHPPVSAPIYGSLIRTSFLAAVLAVLASRTIYNLGTEVSAAREMGSYLLEERLGAGGMGEVWKASHRLLQRPAAVKLIRPEALGAGGQDTQIQQRFEREARATASLESVHTVRLFDYGKTDDGSFFYVMELLDGLDLDSLVRRFGPTPSERAVFLLGQVCRSLEDAHESGMIHRDVKPANIFVCKLGPDHDFIKVLDFGLVKETAASTDLGLTAAGVVAGTPAFMAPEVATGSAPVGPATDIYMLGCVGYWLLTGAQIFEGETPLSIISQHISAVPVPVSRRTEMTVPSGLEDLIMQCLAKEPDQRPQSAHEVYRRLMAFDLDRPWTRERAMRWWQTHRPTEGGPTGGDIDDRG